MDAKSNLNNPRMTSALFAILVKRLGWNVTIDQTDFDDIAFNQLIENARADGVIEFILVERKRAG